VAHLSPTTDALCARLGEYEAVVEIGIGSRAAVAHALASRGVTVTATDVRDCEVPEGVGFVRDDVFDPDLGVYQGVGAVYALNSPPELHRPIREIARVVGAPFYFTTLGTDPPAIPAEAETIPGDTLFRARERGQPTGGDHDRRRPSVTATDGGGDGDGDEDGDGDDWRQG